MNDVTDDDDTASSHKYVVKSCRELESYLLSLAVRTMYHSQQYTQAYELCNKGLLIIDAHLKECEGKISTVQSAKGTSPSVGVGGLYPLRSRMVRYRSLVMERLVGVSSVEDVMGVREDLAKRYRMAVLAKDGDGICTVLNLMLRDLLGLDQGESFCFNNCGCHYVNESALPFTSP